MKRNVFLRTLFLAALLLISGQSAMAQTPAIQPAPRVQEIPRTQNLQILLLSTAVKPGTAAGPEIPENAQSALDDLQKFLPFKSYRLVDGAWLSATEGKIAQARIAGNGGATYKVALRFRSPENSKASSLFVDAFELEQDMMVQMKDGPQFAGRDLINTAFSIKEGETIVVGTSKADGADGALVVLLTVMPSR